MNHLVQQLQQAIDAFNAGKPDQTRQLCQDILSVDPNHPDTLHLLGIAIACQGNPAQAVPYLKRAADSRPNAPLFNINLGNAYLESNDFENAIKYYRKGLQLDPNHTQAHNGLGAAMERQGQFEPALASFKKAIACSPTFAQAHANLGQLLVKYKQFSEAEAPLRQSIQLDPRQADPYIKLGIVCAETHREAEALQYFEKAITVNPRLGEAYYHMALLLEDQHQHDRAKECLQRLLAVPPITAAEHLTTAAALAHLKRYPESLQMAKKAIQLAPKDPAILVRAAFFERNELLFDDARQHLQQALTIRPRFPQALNAIGYLCETQLQFQQALNYYDQAIAIDPNYVEGHWNRSLIRLTVGQFEGGWEDHEWRWQLSRFTSPVRHFPWPLWDGQPLQGKTIVVHQEQGFGDGIQFARYAPLLAQQGAQVIVECIPDLITIFQSLPGIAQVIERGQPISHADYHCPFLTLPKIFKTNLQNIPTNVPYISPDPIATQQWAQRINQLPAKLRVGLVWAGRPDHGNDRNRSMELQTLAPLAQVPGVAFYSLQKGPASAQVQSPPPEMNITDCSNDLNNFADTAALISALDLLICVDTAPVHLAGAMNKPAWLMLPYNFDWRWLENRLDSPWYPSLRLFRQSQPRNWNPVIADITQALTLRVANQP